MATLSSQKIAARSFALMASGFEYGEEKHRSLLVIDRHPSNNGYTTEHECNAHGFDAGSLRQTFQHHAQARDHLKALQAGRLKINQFRGIDPQSIRIHEWMLEVSAIDFTDEEQETLTLAGAIDAMKYGDRQTVKTAFPALAALSITAPRPRQFLTRNGNMPAIRHFCYWMVREATRTRFNELAQSSRDDLQALADDGGSAAAKIHKDLSPNCYFNTNDGLLAVAEEVGKVRLGLSGWSCQNPQILDVRFYDVNEVERPSLPVPENNKLLRALDVLSQQDPRVARTIISALQARGLAPRLDDKPVLAAPEVI